MSIENENLDTVAQPQDENGLEQYGVWVKKTPEEELAKEVRDTHDDTDISDIFLDDIDFDNLPDTGSLSSADEETVIDSDLNGKIEEALDAEEQSAQTDTADDSMPDTAALEDFAADLQEFGSPGEEQNGQNPVPSVEEVIAEKDIETVSDGLTEEVDLDEYMADTENPEESLLDEKPLDIDLTFEDNFETITPDFPKEEAPSETEFEVEDVSDMFDPEAVEDIKPEMTSAKDAIPDVTEIPEMADLGEMEEFAESTAYDFPVDFGARTKENKDKDAKPAEDTGTDDTDYPMETVDIDDFNTDSAPSQKDASEKDASSETVYNISVHADDESDNAEKESPAAEETPAVQAMSSALFEKIMGELSLLRRDITDLKIDLNTLKNSETEDNRGETDDIAPKTGGGFFSDDEEDETIALSGDELNNILTSADFTAAAPSQPQEETDDLEAASLEAASKEEAGENISEKAEAPVLNLQETELTEPALDDIDIELDEENRDGLPDEIGLPVSEDLIVDSANDDFFAEDDTPKDIDDTAVHFLSEDPAESADITEAQTAELQAKKTIEIENIESVEEETEGVFEDTDIAVAAEDVFADTEIAEAEAEKFEEAAEEIKEEAELEPALEEPVPEENILEAAEEPPAEEETEQEISPAFDMDFEEENASEDLSQFSPVGEVFNSKQWLSEEEAAAEADEAALEGIEETEIEIESEKRMQSDSADENKNFAPSSVSSAEIPQNMRAEIKSVLAYMDQLLENLPEEKIVEFARSEHFPVYKKLFTELGLS